MPDPAPVTMASSLSTFPPCYWLVTVVEPFAVFVKLLTPVLAHCFDHCGVVGIGEAERGGFLQQPLHRARRLQLEAGVAGELERLGERGDGRERASCC